MLGAAYRWLVLVLLVMGGVCGALGAQQDTPTITKIDPPNWFAGLPDPMLLIKGTGLRDAIFSSADRGVSVTRTVTSPNGHWAMLWLRTQGAAAGTVHLSLRTPAGSKAFEYALAPRRPASDGPLGFSAKDVLYLIMPDRFADGDLTNDPPAESPGSYDRSKPRAYHGGDLRGVRAHLDYLERLGVSAVWLTPVVANDPRITNSGNTDYHGYGATDLYAIDPHLGSLADYKALGAALHQRHMKLLFDDVPNHVGPHHPWVEDPPLPDWFHGSAAHHSESDGVFDSITDPHAAPRSSSRALDGWFVNILPDLNQENPVVAEYLTENMIWWIEEAGIDGLRIDTFPYVPRQFWQGYLGELAELYPHLATVGEVSGSDPTINAFFSGGRALAGFDTHLGTPFDYPLYYALRDVLLRQKPMYRLETILRQDWLYPYPERLVTFLGNHDTSRFLSEPNATPALLRLGVGLIMTLRGTPQLYAGDEIEMIGGDDPDNRRDFPGGFPGDAKDAFAAQGRSADQAAMHDWVAALGHLRAASPALQRGMQQTLLADENVFAYVRTLRSGEGACSIHAGAETESMLVVVNRADASRAVEIPMAGTVLAGCKSLVRALGAGMAPALGAGTSSAAQAMTGEGVTVTMPPFGFEVYRLR